MTMQLKIWAPPIFTELLATCTIWQRTTHCSSERCASAKQHECPARTAAAALGLCLRVDGHAAVAGRHLGVLHE